MTKGVTWCKSHVPFIKSHDNQLVSWGRKMTTSFMKTITYLKSCWHFTVCKVLSRYTREKTCISYKPWFPSGEGGILTTYVDVDYGCDLHTKRSTPCMHFKLWNAPRDWSSKATSYYGNINYWSWISSSFWKSHKQCLVLKITYWSLSLWNWESIYERKFPCWWLDHQVHSNLCTTCKYIDEVYKLCFRRLFYKITKD